MSSSSLADDGDLDMTDLFCVGEFPVGEFPVCCCWSMGGGADRGPLAQTLGKLACRVNRLKKTLVVNCSLEEGGDVKVK
jgi:hypothetical protein